MKLKVFVDLRHWTPKGFTGVGQVARHATLALLRNAPQHEFLLFAHPEILAGIHAPNATAVPTTVSLTSHPSTEWAEQFHIPRLIRRLGANRYLSFENRVPLLAGIPACTWIHDASLSRFPHAHPWKYHLLMKAYTLLSRFRADLVFTPSDFSAHECVKVFGIRPAKVRVCPLGDSGLAIKERQPIQPKFLLCIGATNPRKNLMGLCQAFAEVRRTHPELELHLTGNPQEWTRLRQHGFTPPQGTVFLGHVHENELPTLYSQCAGAVNPSFYEGFGIPLLDAAQAGAPLACSDIAPHRALLGESALWFDPAAPDSIASTLHHLLDHPERALAKLTRAFTWDRCAQAMLEAMEGL